MSEFQFSVVDRPEVTVKREKKPNPFVPAVKDMWENREKHGDKAIQFSVPMGDESERKGGRKVYSGVESALRLLRMAGAEVGCTVRTTVQNNVDGNKPKKGTATVQFWTAEKITRKGKDK